MTHHVDFLIVGAGFAGAVLAERIATQLDKTCLVIERRNHIGGNAYDHYDKAGVLLHDYGPHYFRTNSLRIVNYLSQFTAWREVEYKILSWTNGRFWQFPINLYTFEQLIGRPSTSEEMEAQLSEWRVTIISSEFLGLSIFTRHSESCASISSLVDGRPISCSKVLRLIGNCQNRPLVQDRILYSTARHSVNLPR